EGGRRLRGAGVARMVPGTPTHADVLALCGPPDEDRVRRGAPGLSRSLVYRATRRIPCPRLAVGRLTTVARWDEEQYELEIELNGDGVSAVQSRVSRAKAAS